MSEQFNQELSLSGKIPSGLFNNMFEFTGSWQKDAASTKSLAFDGWCITLYTVALSKAQIVLRDHVKQAVPSTWEPAALARLHPDLILVLPKTMWQSKILMCFSFSVVLVVSRFYCHFFSGIALILYDTFMFVGG
jgi:hypothetical protein